MQDELPDPQDQEEEAENEERPPEKVGSQIELVFGNNDGEEISRENVEAGEERPDDDLKAQSAAHQEEEDAHQRPANRHLKAAGLGNQGSNAAVRHRAPRRSRTAGSAFLFVVGKE